MEAGWEGEYATRSWDETWPNEKDEERLRQSNVRNRLSGRGGRVVVRQVETERLEVVVMS